MTCWAVLATGPSMSQAVADSVRGRCKAVAVSDAYRLAEWADALVSTDAAWWKAHPAALEFAGLKFSVSQVEGVERVVGEGAVSQGSNSGLLGLHIACKLGASKILLLGFDLRGSHFFGPHPLPLKNTQPHRFDVFKTQFARFKPRGVQIINCTPKSGLDVYLKMDLAEALKDN